MIAEHSLESVVMCAVIFPVLRRLLSSFVLTCFLWTTLFQTLAFAEREPVLFETRGEHIFAHFNLGIQKLERSPSPTSKGSYTPEVESRSSSPTEFIIPLGKTRVETQALIDFSSLTSLYEKLTIVDGGFSWTSYGVDFYLHDSGNLIVSKNSKIPNPSESLHLYNPHGAIIFKDDLQFEHLILSTEEVISEGNLSVNSLSLQGKMTYTNKGFLSVSTLLFNDEFIDPSSCVGLSEFINEGTYIATEDAEIKGRGSFTNAATGVFEAPDGLSLVHTDYMNHGSFNVRGKTTLALTKSLSNEGAMIFGQDVDVTGSFVLHNRIKMGPVSSSKIVRDAPGILVKGNLLFADFAGKIDNRNEFSALTMQGRLAELDNQKIFAATSGFNDLTIDRLIKHASGHIRGDGTLTFTDAENAGRISSSMLTLGITGSFDNSRLLAVADLKTHGAGSFNQRGTLDGKKAVINNETFTNETKINRPELDLSFGEQVTTFHNQADTLLKTKTLSFAKSASPTATATNEGVIVTGHFDNSTATFVNQKHIQTVTWDQRGAVFKNEQHAAISVTGEATVDTDTFDNDGSLNFCGTLTGLINDLTNNGNVTTRGKAVLSGSVLLNNQVLSAQDDLDWSGNTFENTKDLVSTGTVRIKSKQLLNSGRFATTKGTVYNGESFKNSGDFGSKGDITGVIDTIDNTKEITSETNIRLKGKTLTNSNTLNANHLFIYEGQSFTSTETATLHARTVGLTTTIPLTLEGTVQGDRSATFTAPSVENKANLTVVKGKATFNTVSLANQGNMNLDELVFDGKTLANSTGTFTADRYQRTAPLEHLLNKDKGTFVVRNGGFSAQKIENNGKLVLESGQYQVHDWDNAEGDATIDRFSVTSLTPTFAGKLDVAHFIAPEQGYKTLTVTGETTLRAGGFKTDVLTLTSTLTLGKGHYRITHLTGTNSEAKLILLDGAHVTVGTIDYVGTTSSTVNLVFDPSMGAPALPAARSHEPLTSGANVILGTHTQRSTTFGTLPDALSPDFAAGRDAIYAQTLSISQLLSRVDPTRYATDEERRIILQAVMGSEITAHIHNTEQQSRLGLQPHRLTKTDSLFKHFEILRITEKLARAFAKHIKEVGCRLLDSVIDTYNTDFATLLSYSSVKKDTFVLWFKSVFEKHKASVPAPKPHTTTVTGTTKNIFDTQTHRREAHNTIPSASDAEKAVKKGVVYNDTLSIINILKDKNRVDPNRYATDEERKTILQAVMGAEITAHLHAPQQRTALTLSAQLPTLRSDDPLYKHFEILRLTEKLSRILVNHVTAGRSYGLDITLNVYRSDCATLSNYSGLNAEMFLLWFEEIFAQHTLGFPVQRRDASYKNTLLFSTSQSSSFTILGGSAGHADGIIRLGPVESEKDILLKSAGDTEKSNWAADFLKKYGQQVHLKGDLFIEAERFSTWDELSLPYHVHLTTLEFINYAKIKINGLTLHTTDFDNGHDNDHMGTIECYGKLQAKVQNDVDNRFGVIKTVNKASITSKRGLIRVGAPKAAKESVLDKASSELGPCSDTLLDVDVMVPNGARISSGDALEMYATSSSIDVSFGSTYAKTASLFSAKQKITNTSGTILGGSTITFDADELENLIGEAFETQSYSVPALFSMNGSGPFCLFNVLRYVQHPKSGPATIKSLTGNVYINVRMGKNKGSRILSPHAIRYRSGAQYQTTAPARFTHDALPLRVRYTQDRSSWWGSLGVGGKDLPAIPAIFQGGQEIHINTGDMVLSGSMNAPKVVMDLSSLIAKATGQRTDPTVPNIGITIDLGEVILNAMKNNSVFLNSIEQGGGVSIDTFGPERPLPGDINTLPLMRHADFTGKDLPPFLFSPDVMRYAMMDALYKYLGTLNIRGKSGDELLYELFHTKKNKEKSKKAGQLIATERPSLFDEGTLFTIIKEIGNQLYRVPYLLATPDMFNPHADANISGHQIDVLTRDDAVFDRSVIGAYAPSARQEVTKREVNTIESTSRVSVDLPASVSPPSTEKPDCYVNIVSQGRLDATASEFHADLEEGTVNIEGKTGLSVLSDKEARLTRDGSEEVKIAAKVSGSHVNLASTDGDVDMCAVDVKAKGFLIKAAQKIREHVLTLHRESTHTEFGKDSVTTIQEHWSTASVCTYDVTNGVTMISGDTIDLVATKVRANVFKLFAQKGVRIHDAQNSYSCTTQTQTQGSGWFGKDKEFYSAYQRVNSQGMDAGNTKVEIILGQRGPVDMTNVSIMDLTLDSKGGTISCHLGKNYESYASSEKSNNAFWQSQSMHSESHQTATQSTIGSFKVISSPEAPVKIMIESVRGQTAEFLKRIEANGGIITEHFWDEVHTVVHKQAGGPTAATAALIAIAITAITAGTGAAAAAGAAMATSTGFAATGVASTMFAAGFTSVCTSAVMSLANNEGDPRKAAKSFTSRDTLQSVGMSMLSAGITHGLLSGFDLPTDVSTINTFGGHAANQGANMASRITTDLTFTGRTDGVAATLGAIAGTIGGYVSTKIGVWYKGSEGTAIESIAHKTLHAIKGGTEGLIISLGSGGLDAKALGKVVAGAAGGFISEVVADTIAPTHNALGETQNYSDKQIRQTQAAARMVVGTIAFAAGMNAEEMGIAMFSATTSLDHNFAASAKAYLGVEGGELEEEKKPDVSKTGDEETTTEALGSGKESDTKLAVVGDTQTPLNAQTPVNQTPIAQDVDRGRTQKRTAIPKKRSGSPSKPLQESMEIQAACIAGERAHRADSNASFLGKLGSIFQEHCHRQSMRDSSTSYGLRQVQKEAPGVAKAAAHYTAKNPEIVVAGALTTAAIIYTAPAVALYVGGATLASVATELTVGLTLGAAAGNLQSQHHCRTNNITGVDALVHSTVSTFTGAVEVPLFSLAPFSLAVGGVSLYGAGSVMNQYSPGSGDLSCDLGGGMLAGATIGGLTKVVGWGTNAFNASRNTVQQNITLQNAGNVSKSSTGIVVAETRIAANLNNPLTMAANRNALPLAFVAEAEAYGSMQSLAQKVSGGSGGSRFATTMSAGEGFAGGSGGNATRTALDTIASGESGVSGAARLNVLTVNPGGGLASSGAGRPNLTVVESGHVQSEINGISNLKSSVADHSANISGTQAERLSRAEGLAKLQANPKLATRRIDTIGKSKISQNSASSHVAADPLHAERLVTRPNENPCQYTSDIFNQERVTWTAPSGTRQTYQVTQRTDIDWGQVRTLGDKRFKGKTNFEAANAGLNPQLPDGSFATLHHLNQNGLGKLVEASTRYHGVSKAGQDTLHSLYGSRTAHPTNPVNHAFFKQDNYGYWKDRIKGVDFNG